jgi:hypothetical protein
VILLHFIVNSRIGRCAVNGCNQLTLHGIDT